MKQITLTLLVLLLAILLAACSPSQITTSIKVAINAAEIAIPLVGGTAGLSPLVQAAVVNYLTEANTALTTVTTILESGKPAAVEAAQITAILSKVASVNLPPGTPQIIVNAVGAVADAVVKVLANFATNGKPKLMKPGTMFKLSSSDHKNLSEAKVKLAEQADQLAQLKKR